MSNQSFKTIQSEVLGEDIIVLLDPDAIDEALKAHKVIYREEELDALSGLSDETLKEVHRIKKAFGGWVCGPKVLV